MFGKVIFVCNSLNIFLLFLEEVITVRYLKILFTYILQKRMKISIYSFLEFVETPEICITLNPLTL